MCIRDSIFTELLNCYSFFLRITAFCGTVYRVSASTCAILDTRGNATSRVHIMFSFCFPISRDPRNGERTHRQSCTQNTSLALHAKKEAAARWQPFSFRVPHQKHDLCLQLNITAFQLQCIKVMAGSICSLAFFFQLPVN